MEQAPHVATPDKRLAGLWVRLYACNTKEDFSFYLTLLLSTVRKPAFEYDKARLFRVIDRQLIWPQFSPEQSKYLHNTVCMLLPYHYLLACS